MRRSKFATNFFCFVLNISLKVCSRYMFDSGRFKDHQQFKHSGWLWVKLELQIPDFTACTSLCYVMGTRAPTSPGLDNGDVSKTRFLLNAVGFLTHTRLFTKHQVRNTLVLCSKSIYPSRVDRISCVLQSREKAFFYFWSCSDGRSSSLV